MAHGIEPGMGSKVRHVSAQNKAKPSNSRDKKKYLTFNVYLQYPKDSAKLSSHALFLFIFIRIL